MKILITGAAGQLGSAFAGAGAAAHDVVALSRGQLDLTDAAATCSSIAAHRPDLIVNCAAYNEVDAAEARPVEALAVNTIAVRTLAGAAAEIGATLVHYSTDFVFDGTGDRPYTEADPPNPQSVYAVSKLLGEWMARDAPAHYVLRVESLFGGARRRSSIDRVIEGLRLGNEVRVFADRTVSPSYVPDVVRATLALVERQAEPGLYHCVNDGSTTWDEIGRVAARLLGVEPRLVAVRMSEVTMTARRPLFCALSNRRLAGAGVVMPSWQDALTRHVAAMDADDATGLR